MKMRFFLLLLVLPGLILAQETSEEDVWQPLRFLEGKWEGQGEGLSGLSSLTQEYRFILNGRFLQMTTKAVFKPQEKNPRGEVHEDLGLFSYDLTRKTFVMRGFYVEGFVNQYVLQSISEDGKTFTLVTEQIENAPPGTKAKLMFTKTQDDEFEQSFHVAWPGQEFSCYSVNRLKRRP